MFYFAPEELEIYKTDIGLGKLWSETHWELNSTLKVPEYCPVSIAASKSQKELMNIQTF